MLRHVRRSAAHTRCRVSAPGESIVSHASEGDLPHDAFPRPNRRARQASSWLVMPADDAEAGDSPLASRIVSNLLEAGFPSLLIQGGRVVLSGFVIADEADGQVRIHWTGTDPVNA